MLSMMSWLVPLARIAFTDIGVDELAHTRPPIVPVQDIKRFCLTRMSRDDQIMHLFEETDAERLDIRNSHLSSEQEMKGTAFLELERHEPTRVGIC